MLDMNFSAEWYIIFVFLAFILLWIIVKWNNEREKRRDRERRIKKTINVYQAKDNNKK